MWVSTSERRYGEMGRRKGRCRRERDYCPALCSFELLESEAAVRLAVEGVNVSFGAISNISVVDVRREGQGERCR